MHSTVRKFDLNSCWIVINLGSSCEMFDLCPSLIINLQSRWFTVSPRTFSVMLLYTMGTSFGVTGCLCRNRTYSNIFGQHQVLSLSLENKVFCMWCVTVTQRQAQNDTARMVCSVCVCVCLLLRTLIHKVIVTSEASLVTLLSNTGSCECVCLCKATCPSRGETGTKKHRGECSLLTFQRN